MSDHAYPDLADQVRSDPESEPFEREFGLIAAGDEDAFHMTVKGNGAMSRALRHPHIEVIDVTVRQGRHEYETVADPENIPAEADIVGVNARVPVGLVKIQSNPRKNSQHSSVISNHT